MLDVATKFQCLGLTIEGFSRSGYHTWIAIPELDLMFDIGTVDKQRAKISQVLLSHVHTDHSHGVILYRHLRELQNTGSSKIYLPEAQTAQFLTVIEEWDKLVGKFASKRCHLIGTLPGQRLDLKKGVWCKTFKVFHGIDSLGYSVYRTKKSLKDCYQGLPGPEIGQLVRSGVEVNQYRDQPLVTYIGDSTIKTFHSNPELLKAPILITECTYVDRSDRANAKKYGHTHIDEIAEVLDAFEGQFLILKHFSLKYSRHEIVTAIKRRLPTHLQQKTGVLLDASKL